jgi:ADP-ribosyl-[dinitrogen reductase] hydrolase
MDMPRNRPPHPLDQPQTRIDLVPLPDGCGRLALLACPGLAGLGAMAGGRGADAVAQAAVRDMAALKERGATLLLTLLGDEELAFLDLPTSRLAALAGDAGLAWAQAPIGDFGAPAAAFESAWPKLGADVHARLDRGETVGIHCRAGLGRTGTVAARILVERSIDADAAINLVRRCRPGTLETAAQVAHVKARRGFGRPGAT